MKICHFSDSHLGAGDNHPKRGESGLTLRQEDMINGFIRSIDDIIKIKPDVCIHSGDLFHTVRPTNRIAAIAAEHFHRLSAINNIPTILIAGNHDAPKQPHIGAAIEIFSQIDNLHVVAHSKLEIIKIKDAAFFALPHCLTTTVLKDELEKCVPLEDSRFNVLIMHGVAADMPQFSMADLGEQEIPLEVMNRFDYTALGHFHDYTKVAKTAYYSGSTERLSQSEREADKGFAVVELNPFKVTFQKIPSRPMLDIKTINAAGKRGDQLVSIIKEKLEQIDSSDKIIRVKVAGVTEETLKTIPTEIITELKQKAYALNISFEKEESDESTPQFGRSAIGRLDQEFLRFLDTVGLDGFDRERLKKDALKYLSENE